MIFNCPGQRDRLLAHGDWAISLVRQFLFVESDVLRMSALESSAYQPVAAIARKLRGELKYHAMHVESMFPKLAVGTDESRSKMQSALDYLYPYALGIFEPSAHDTELEQAGIAPSESSLRESWTGRVEELIAEAGLMVAKNARQVEGSRHGPHDPALTVERGRARRAHNSGSPARRA